MKHYDKIHERTVAKVLIEHVEQGVPVNVDIWPLVERRLAAGQQLARESSGERDDQPQDFLTGRSPLIGIDKKMSLPRVYNMVRSLGAMMALIIVVALAAVSFAGLSNRLQEEGVAPASMTATPTLSQGEGTLLFSIPAGDDETGYITGDRIHLHGFDVAEDGTFWLVDAANRLLHYSASGERLSVTNIDLKANMPLPPANPQATKKPTGSKDTELKAGNHAIYDLELQGSNIWVSSGGDALTVYKVAPDGNILAEYSPIMTYPGEGEGRAGREYDRRLVQGGDGEMWLSGAPPIKKDERGISISASSTRMYAKVKNFDYNNIEYVDGFPGKNKLYKYKAPDGVANVIMAGDLPVTITITGTVSGLQIITELPDESFYVKVRAIAKDIAGVPDGPHNYVMHYSAGGKLIERAWVPPDSSLFNIERRVRDLSVGPDGALYDLRGVGFYPGPSTNRVDIVRLDMYPPSQPLPPIPTPTDTPDTPVVPTPIPTAPRPNIPLPVPSTTAPQLPTETTVPSPTTIQDLATLAQQSDVIVRVKANGSQGATGSVIIYLQAEKWLKKPDGIPQKKLIITTPSRNDGMPFTLARHFWDEVDAEHILFLSGNGLGPWSYDEVPSYRLTDTVASIFTLRHGKIEQAGVEKYTGWTIEKFEEALAPLIPTPASALSDKPTQELAGLAQQSHLIAEVELVTSPPPNEKAFGSRLVLQNVRVVKWLKKPDGFIADFVGLALEPEQQTRLSSGSDRYIAFLQSAENYESHDVCDLHKSSGYHLLSNGTGGIFEINDNKVVRAGIEAYEGLAVEKFEESLRALIPTPAPQPPSETGISWDLPRLANEVEIIAEVERQAEGKADQYWKPVTFRVKEWLKKPEGFTGNSIEVAVDEGAECRMSLGAGHYILFVHRIPKYPQSSPLHHLYHFPGPSSGIFGIRDNRIDYAGVDTYWGWPLDEMKQAIRSALP